MGTVKTRWRQAVDDDGNETRLLESTLHHRWQYADGKPNELESLPTYFTEDREELFGSGDWLVTRDGSRRFKLVD